VPHNCRHAIGNDSQTPEEIKLMKSRKEELIFLLSKVGHFDKIKGFNELLLRVAKIGVKDSTK
jgi:hypothetical protein